jgi:hypothetical protein
MNQERLVQTTNAIPRIGNCPKCQTEILASHPYAWCTKCNQPLPYGINMERRPIMYGTIKVTPASFATETAKSAQR